MTKHYFPLLLALGMVSCGEKENKEEPAKEKTEAPAQETVMDTEEEEEAPALRDFDASRLAGVVNPDSLTAIVNEYEAETKGLEVTVEGYYMNLTTIKGEEHFNVTVKRDAEFSQDLVLVACSMDQLESVQSLTQGTKVSITGKLDGKFFDEPYLKECTVTKME